MQRLKCLHVTGLSIYKQLQYEEILLRNTQDNWVILNNGIEEASIVLGFSGKKHELVDVELAKRDGIQLIRRFTGGGTVIVDKDTCFSTFIMNSGDAGCQPYPRDIMKWSENMFSPIFEDNEDLKFSLRENDYVVNDNKVGGNAQTITKNRWVHHTSWLFDFNVENMKYLRMPKKIPEYRKHRDHKDFLTTLKNLQFTSPSKFNDRVLQSLHSYFQVENIQLSEIDEVVASLPAEAKLVRTKREDYDIQTADPSAK